jgi:hypothetical protein
MKQFIVNIFILSLFMTNCKTTVPFTSHIKENCGLDNYQLKQIQFYTSSEIVLYKIDQKNKARIKDGKVILSERESSETIIIPKNTPCILAEVLGDKLLLSFESGDGRFVAFGVTSNDYYTLMAKSWEGNGGVLEYGHVMYQTNNGNAFLKVNMKKLKQLQNKYRYIEGRKVGRH